ncbi:uncharacterized protein YALI1_E22807g [Yarrowia lipolytica]|uniref:Uncharacterized protein n=1 Tax=Yarrowia lipolytica TaxID=4952 RepID=A0A1D8NJ26_YARLL|nr:hypothetical protein YALI1_E22807g [Yarrowia lipolytica]
MPFVFFLVCSGSNEWWDLEWNVLVPRTPQRFPKHMLGTLQSALAARCSASILFFGLRFYKYRMYLPTSAVDAWLCQTFFFSVKRTQVRVGMTVW